MTLAELEAAGNRASAIKRALTDLQEVERQLALINRHGAGKVWNIHLCLNPNRDRYDREVSVPVNLPFGVVQQQAVNAVIAARRAVVLAGGELPTASEQVQRGGR